MGLGLKSCQASGGKDRSAQERESKKKKEEGSEGYNRTEGHFPEPPADAPSRTRLPDKEEKKGVLIERLCL